MRVSTVGLFARQMREREERRRSLSRIQPYTRAQSTPEARRRRVARALGDFWYYHREYFPAEMYSDGYTKPGRFHRNIVSTMSSPGLHLFFGPRKMGKTTTGKIFLSWQQLTGQIRLSGVFSETLEKAGLILEDVGELIQQNERILHDFNPKFSEFNSESYRFCVQEPSAATGWISCGTFSEGRSAKGYSRSMSRPQALLGDDVETTTTPLSAEANRRRILIISESFQSLSDGGNFTIFANDFSEESALHQSRTEIEKGLAPKNWHAHVYPAWKGRSLWPERYPANSEEELREQLQPLDEQDWQGSYQQNPIPPEGFMFLREHYCEWDVMPTDARGVGWCDPNLAKKSKGDTTAMPAILFSARRDKYIIARARCRSYSDPHELLDDYFTLCGGLPVYARGFDGNVNQESIWTQFVRDYCLIKAVPYPPLEYRNYRVNDLAKSAQIIWNQKRFEFPPGFIESEEGRVFMRQMFAFQGKKKKGKDDAPDSVISGTTLLHERGFATRDLGGRGDASKVIVITDSHSF